MIVTSLGKKNIPPKKNNKGLKFNFFPNPSLSNKFIVSPINPTTKQRTIILAPIAIKITTGGANHQNIIDPPTTEE